MGTKLKKPRSMRSRKSGLKTMLMIQKNQQVLRKMKRGV